ncbi:hypothetical protein D3C87_1614180 [compost metagenome]
MKPTKMALQRRQPTCSPSKGMDSAATISGAEARMEWLCASPTTAKEKIEMTICTARSTPRPICSQGRLAMTAPLMPPADLAAIKRTKTAKAQYRSMAIKTGG